ncbi:hypothetical protein R3P38DRAFT_2923822 [Favolaschia claudopus]|uniref:Uncharacterized protein n=1 Tax=Favolaschia claudopus TaxID=2862362 RepID=A0AAW0BX37_9AGAR
MQTLTELTPLLWMQRLVDHVNEHPSNTLILLGATIAALSFAVIQRRAPSKAASTPRTNTPRSLVNPKRPFGEWTPQPFAYPQFDASPYVPMEIKPPMYRPFRWGEYHITMGIRSMQWGEWIELDDQYDTYHGIRQDRVERKGKSVVQVLPSRTHQRDETVHVDGGAAAAIELVHELAEYLSRRYPQTFQVRRHATMPGYPTGWDGAAPVKSVRIVHLDQEYQLPLPLPLNDSSEKIDLERDGLEAMRIAGLLIQDDLALMVEGSDGGYYFMAGAIIVPGFWRMDDKIGMRLEDIHISGDVPQYQEKLQVSLERFFRRLAVDKPIARNNYFVQVSPLPSATPSVDPDELAWGENVLGPEDKYASTKGSSYGTRPMLVVTPETLRLQLAQEPGIAARFASAVRSWPDSVKEYKGEGRYSEVLLRYLDEMAARVEGEAEVKPYPY